MPASLVNAQQLVPSPAPTFLRQAVLSVTQDEFFREHKDSNFGDLAAAVKTTLDEYSSSRGEAVTSAGAVFGEKWQSLSHCGSLRLHVL